MGVLILLLVMGAVVGWRWYGSSRPPEFAVEQEKPLLEREAAVEESPGITVHVTGAVRSPGVYTLEKGARALDALNAAGGPAQEADEHAFNLAQPLYDGQRIEIPFIREEGNPGRGDGDRRININTASAKDLEALPNIGPARASQIVEYREGKGFFTSVDDLAQVPGIGLKTVEALRDMVTIY